MFRLLDLPRELRDIIHLEVLRSTRVSYPYIGIRYIPYLQTSHQIYNEALPFYGWIGIVLNSAKWTKSEFDILEEEMRIMHRRLRVLGIKVPGSGRNT